MIGLGFIARLLMVAFWVVVALLIAFALWRLAAYVFRTLFDVSWNEASGDFHWLRSKLPKIGWKKRK